MNQDSIYNLNKLPAELVKKIASFLLPRDVLNLSMTSRFFNDVRNIQLCRSDRFRTTFQSLNVYCNSFVCFFPRHSRFAIQTKMKSGSFSSSNSLAPAVYCKITANSWKMITGRSCVIVFSCVINSNENFIS